MRYRRLILLVLFFSVGCSKTFEDNFDSEFHIDRWVAMWNAYDLFLVDQLFLIDDRVTYLSSEKEGVIKGIEAVREHHRGFGFVEGGKDQDNKLWVENVHGQQFGNTAIVMGTWLFQRGHDDTVNIQRGPFTFVYVQDEDGYRIVHANFANYCEPTS